MTIGLLKLQSLYARRAAFVAKSKSAGSVDNPMSIHFFDHSEKLAICASVILDIFFITTPCLKVTAPVH